MTILVSALELSANFHLKQISDLSKNINFIGICDKNIGKSIVDITNQSVIGIFGLLFKISIFFKTINKMVILSEKADKVFLIDSSLFNLYLAKRIKKKFPNKQIIYYILPQAWMTRKGRVKKLEKYCDRLLGILPFEIKLYKKKAQYVGNPILDELDIENINNPRENAIAYMAGSRKAEIKNLMPIFQKIRKKFNKEEAILIIPPNFTENQIKEYYGDISNFKISKEVSSSLKKVKFAFICSGTATLEASLLNTPFTLIYILPKFDLWVYKTFYNKKQIGLANILLTEIDGSTLHKEFVENKINFEEVAQEYYNFNSENFLQGSIKIKKYLKYGSSKNVLKILEE